MGNIILQHYDGELGELEKLSVKNIEQYAWKRGAKYRLITGRPFDARLTPPCQKVQMLNEEFDGFDQVLMLDIDMFVPRGMEVNIFEQQGVGLYNPIQKMLHTKIVKNYPLLASSSNPYWGGAIYKMDLELRKALRKELTDRAWMENFNQPYHFEDEGIMHVLATRANINPEGAYLDPRWCYDNYLPDPAGAYMIHVRTKITPTGPKQEKIKNYYDLVEKGIL